MALQRGNLILVDANVIIEAHRVRRWKGMANQFRLVTVAEVFKETQTGHQNRTEEQNIDPALLREQLSQIAEVSKTELATMDIYFPDHGLDPGEHHLVAFARTFEEPAWLLNSPDIGTIRVCSQAGWLDQLISLEAMATALGMPHGTKLRGNYTEAWLRRQVNKFRFGLG
ncbi:hypothetical protein IC757_02805 [Wenzhouxiangella sp. AB-CW3]|uniref:hypothetical protein n=1 Tax=Wenzhouxiangella sp. AB-CW3 TaxID=2771012 RepID=UPI00168BD04C|nr:hypothetical protein [Wenzhouxiangella sp. AB-CW3]QOC23106.1 hypothetical protein IC757_02805 [Wenzhouxiangella sp. AB-CW3]